jgi:hypothetical protein
MTVDLDPILKAVGQLGVFVVAAGILWWALLIPHKDARGRKRSPLLIVGSEHDRALDEATASEERTRKFYETQITEIRKQADVRVGEVRGYRDETMAINVDLLASLSSATRDIAQVLEILDRASREPESKSG